MARELHGTERPPAPSAKPYVPLRTPWDPDLQGIWPSTDMVGVPFERPAELDRCITRGVLGSTFPVIYNNGNQIQNEGNHAMSNILSASRAEETR